MTCSIDLRKKVLSFISDGGSKSEVVRLFKISRDTLYRWLRAEEFGVHTSSISRAMKTLGIVKKERGYIEWCIMKRQEFCEKLKVEHRMMGFKNLIYIDRYQF